MSEKEVQRSGGAEPPLPGAAAAGRETRAAEEVHAARTVSRSALRGRSPVAPLSAPVFVRRAAVRRRASGIAALAAQADRPPVTPALLSLPLTGAASLRHPVFRRPQPPGGSRGRLGEIRRGRSGNITEELLYGAPPRSSVPKRDSETKGKV
ncbi:hypothetical protein GN956_G25001 [Arapaima gigas]